MIDSTIADNTGTSGSGGVLNFGAGGRGGTINLTLEDSVVAGNIGSNGSQIEIGGAGTITDNGNNLLGDSSESSAQAFSGFTPASSDLVETSDNGNVALSAIVSSTLASNGGPTQTLSLPAGSPAIAAGVPVDYPGTTTTVSTDQRGYPRPASKPDIGAYQTAGTYSIVVNQTNDALDNPATSFNTQLGNNVTLRDAINAVDNSGGNATITFDPTVFATPQAIILSEGTLTLSNIPGSTQLSGPAAGLTDRWRECFHDLYRQLRRYRVDLRLDPHRRLGHEWRRRFITTGR